MIYKIGKIVFFQAKVTEKSSNLMTFASINDTSLSAAIFTMLNTYTVSGLDVNKKASAYISENKLYVQTLDENSLAAAWEGDVRISGWWITN